MNLKNNLKCLRVCFRGEGVVVEWNRRKYVSGTIVLLFMQHLENFYFHILNIQLSVKIFNYFTQSYNSIQILHYFKNQNKFISYLFKAFRKLQKLIDEKFKRLRIKNFSCEIYCEHLHLNTTKFTRQSTKHRGMIK